MAKILVTGAAGFIGGAVAREAAARGHEVHGVGHGALAPEALAARGLRGWGEGTVSAVTLDRCGVLPDVVVHCAGGASVGASIEATERDRERTVAATGELVAWLARRAPGARLVQVSSGAVYGEAAATPENRGEPLRPISPYGRHKAEAEAVVRQAGRASGLAAVVVRLFSVYGPGLRKQLLWDACGRMVRGGGDFHGTGEESRDWLDVSDVADLLLRAASAASCEVPVIDGGTGAAVRLAEVLDTLAQSFHPPPTIRFLGGGRPGDPRSMIADPRAARSLGWRPQTPLALGLGRYAEWYRAGAL